MMINAEAGSGKLEEWDLSKRAFCPNGNARLTVSTSLPCIQSGQAPLMGTIGRAIGRQKRKKGGKGAVKNRFCFDDVLMPYRYFAPPVQLHVWQLITRQEGHFTFPPWQRPESYLDLF